VKPRSDIVAAEEDEGLVQLGRKGRA
jgi:hypothetical protein